MMGTPSHEQDRNADFKNMTISHLQTDARQLVETKVTFEHGKETLDVATFASLATIGSNPILISKELSTSVFELCEVLTLISYPS